LRPAHLNILIGGGYRGREVEAGAREETADQAWPVLHLFEPGLDQRGELGGLAFSDLDYRALEVRPTGSTGWRSSSYCRRPVPGPTLTSDSSDPAAKAASTETVGSTHIDPRTYSDIASRRIIRASRTLVLRQARPGADRSTKDRPNANHRLSGSEPHPEGSWRAMMSPAANQRGGSGALPSWPASSRARVCTHPFHPLRRVALKGQQRRGQYCKQPQLELRSLRSRQQIAGQRQRPLQRVDRIGVGVQPLSHGRAPTAPACRLRPGFASAAGPSTSRPICGPRTSGDGRPLRLPPVTKPAAPRLFLQVQPQIELGRARLADGGARRRRA
jgi:hypothetical protein